MVRYVARLAGLLVRHKLPIAQLWKDHMATFTVHQGKRYRARISLGWIERFASNETIADRLRAAGFTDIAISGSGSTRMAEALWPQPNATAEMPKQIVEVVEV